MKILFLSAWLPFPPINGAKTRIYNLIRQLSKMHEISLIAFARTIPVEKTPRSVRELEKYCQSVRVVPAKPFKPEGLSAYRGIFTSVPRSVFQTYSEEMVGLIKDAINQEVYDVVVASEVYAPSVISLLASNVAGIPKILDAIEIALTKDAYENSSSLLSKIRNGLTWFKLRNFTRMILQKTDGCTVPSLDEMKNLRALAPDEYPIEVVPHSLDLERYPMYDESALRNSLVFTGSFTYGPNLDAILYFTEEIFPMIHKQEPAVNLKVIGDLNGVDPSQFPEYKSIQFTGLVQDVRPHIRKSWLSVVPLRMGGGTRLKIIESMALGTPVVSTRKGAEGLDVTHGENILIADTPQEFSQAVLQVLCSPKLRETLSSAGRALVVEKYNTEVLGDKFEAFLEKIARP